MGNGEEAANNKREESLPSEYKIVRFYIWEFFSVLEACLHAAFASETTYTHTAHGTHMHAAKQKLMLRHRSMPQTYAMPLNEKNGETKSFGRTQKMKEKEI